MSRSKDEWDRVRAEIAGRSKATTQSRGPVPSQSTLALEPPLSGDPADVRLLPDLALNEPRVLPDDPALLDFQSTLTNTPQERSQASNLIRFWERIPRYTCGQIKGVTSSTDSKEIGIVRHQFKDESGEQYTLTMTPANIEVEEGGALHSLFCYPGQNEELIELALIKIAMDNGDILPPIDNSVVDGTRPTRQLPSYGVHFTINQIMQTLKDWGRSRKYPAVIRSLNILNKCHLAIQTNTRRGIDARGAILTELISYKQNGFDAQDRNGFWTARFHPVISLSIHAGLYQQYSVSDFAAIKSAASHSIAKLAALYGRNMSETIPYCLTLSYFQQVTGLLRYKKPVHARQRFMTEIETL